MIERCQNQILERQWMEDDDPNELQGPHYYVHYKGWKNTYVKCSLLDGSTIDKEYSWDEWVHETRVLKYTDTNLKLQQRLKDANTVWSLERVK